MDYFSSFQILPVDGNLRIVDQSGKEISQSAAVQIIESLIGTYGIEDETVMPFVVYLMKGSYGICKIGMTGNIVNRLIEVRRDAQDPEVEVIHVIVCRTRLRAYALEAKLHDLFRSFRFDGEWFTLNDKTIEYFQELRTEESFTLVWGVQAMLFCYDVYNAPRPIRRRIANVIRNTLDELENSLISRR